MSSFPTTQIIPFTYVISSGAMAGNASAQVSLTMQADSSFELLRILGTSSLDTDAETIPNNFSLLITDQSTGRMLSNIRVPQRLVTMQSMQGMMDEKYPIRFPASCVLLFDFLDLSGNTNTVTIALKGYKLFQL